MINKDWDLRQIDFMKVDDYVFLYHAILSRTEPVTVYYMPMLQIAMTFIGMLRQGCIRSHVDQMSNCILTRHIASPYV